MSESKNYNLSSLNDLVEGSDEAINKMIIAFLDSTPKVLEDIQGCFTESDYQRLANLSHKLKSSIDIFGIDDLKEDIRKLEDLCRNNPERDVIEGLKNKVITVSKLVMLEFKRDFPDQKANNKNRG